MARQLLHLALLGIAWPALAEPVPGEAAKSNMSADLVIVGDGEPWLVAAACPVLERLGTGDSRPLLLAVGRSPSRAVRDFLRDLAPRQVLTLLASREEDPLPALAKQVRRVGVKPLAATLELARAYWGRTARAVVAPIDDSEAVILGAALAARRGVPTLIYENADNPGALLAALAQLQVDSVVLAGADRSAARSLRAGKILAEELTCRTIEDRLAAEPGAAPVRTLVVARVPEAGSGIGRTAWLAPYLGAARGAPIVLVRSGKAVAIEKAVDEIVARHALHPRSITLLGDYESLLVHKVDTEIVPRDGGPPARLTVEPCMPTGLEATARFGVGRIPLSALDEASLLVARGFGRARLLASRPPELLMLANAAVERWQLPLCEVVSQLSVAEFKNFGVSTREFYRVETDQPAVVEAATTAQVIVFQGHTEHQLLVGKRSKLAKNGDGADGEPLHWRGVPVVILQTCVSLRSEAFRQVHELGGAAMIGTGSPIHSASGSAFMKAMADSVLYRQSALGEALRDARNYFACLTDLKNLRGHSEQAKVRRTALSFRLWGDPELELFGQRLPAPTRAPLACRWEPPDRLLVRRAPKQYPEVRNEEFQARIQPGAEVAGMVVKGSSGLRRVLELNFFRIPLPEGFGADGYSGFSRQGDDGQRGVFRVDPTGRLLYVLYFPGPNADRQSFTLQGVKRPPIERPPGQ